MMDLPSVIGWVMAAFFGGSGLVGLLMLKPKRAVEHALNQEEEDRRRLDTVDECSKTIKAMQEEQSIQEEQAIQCFCILACLKGLAEQGCNGPVHEGIAKMEEYLNSRAHNHD